MSGATVAAPPLPAGRTVMLATFGRQRRPRAVSSEAQESAHYQARRWWLVFIQASALGPGMSAVAIAKELVAEAERSGRQPRDPRGSITALGRNPIGGAVRCPSY